MHKLTNFSYSYPFLIRVLSSFSRKIIFLVFFTFLIAGSIAAQQKVLTLEKAVAVTADRLSEQIPGKSIIAILGFSSPAAELSAYVLDELTARFIRIEGITVVDRTNLEVLQQEMDFQLSGEVSDETMQAIGKKLGVQTIVSGSLTSLGKVYRLTLRAIKVETAAVQGLERETVQSDDTLLALLRAKQPVSANGDFTTGRRVGAGFGNLALGLGSFTMGDWVGGTIVAGGYAAAAGLMLWDIYGLEYEDKMAGVPGGIGIGVAAATVVFGFIRPFFFHKSGQSSQAAAFGNSPLNGMDIVLVSDINGDFAAQFSYTLHF
jgi:TolB-like protein